MITKVLVRCKCLYTSFYRFIYFYLFLVIVLDICCGIGNVSHSLDVKRLVGIDIYQKYLDKYKIRKPSVELICGDAISVCKQFENDTFDVVLLVDAVEHLTKPDALELLRESERICKRTIFVFTPESKSEINVNKPHDAW
jgi:2-polyprenyl-3-methyl-5-hydroxy-6-metoxy-1,4-benzoquinol methylase